MSKTVHLMGIAGSAMTSLAGMFLELGWKVQGSDQNFYPPSSEILKELGVKTFQGFSPEHLIHHPADLVVIGNVISRSNPEAQYVLQQKIPYQSMSAALYEYFLSSKERFVITGTHGKTTTTSLLAWIFTVAQRDPGFFLGGSPLNFDAGYRVGKGKEFAIEGDEYDTAFFEKTPKFLHYGPQYVAITSIEFDHADIYRDLQHIQDQFFALLGIIPASGCILAHRDDPNVCNVVEHSKRQVTWYGLDDRKGYHVRDVRDTEIGKAYSVYNCEEKLFSVEAPLLGFHNVKNVLAATGLAMAAQVSPKQIKQAIESFRGVKKRQQKIGEAQKVSIYEDFAHHPTAIEETINAFVPMTRARGGKLWAIFEPRSNTTRRNIFQERFPQSFEKADHIILASVFRKNDALSEDDLLKPSLIVDRLKAKGKDAYTFDQSVDILVHLKKNVQSQDVVVFMSNGNFQNLPRDLYAALKESG
ncbi:MAG: UDP-N-acetylmuramate:L-alanyl-gamma-D-glutamyl-meso-diaminopimelate ligase [Bdellovibrionales bacterium]|nr:UDP-N-acetylmuramate:L-alanyl-gamma-D-glutamyl-meso-diaminopimelate ligase [Bdellovibrionales bacterium]